MNIKLYIWGGCPFCMKVTRYIEEQNMDVDFVDATVAPGAIDLVEGGGKMQVPCLRIEQDSTVQWLYESDSIIAYLSEQYTS